jgi:hypothetical protein
MIGYFLYIACVWILFRLALAVCRACSSGDLARRRMATGKTPLSTLRFRFYWILFLFFSPGIYYFSGTLREGKLLLPDYHPATKLDVYLDWLWIPLAWFVVTTLILMFLCVGMRPIGALVNTGQSESDYERWLAAGGHPYWDCNTWCNFDHAVVRAAIGRPPESDYCYNCGSRLTGLLRLGGNFGNLCNNCGVYNDSFEQT